MNKFTTAAAVGLLIAYSTASLAQKNSESARTTSSSTVQPDNSKSNKLDESNRTVTAEDQSNNSADIELTKRIRKSVIADKSLSTYAHNVKIVTVNGKVTLNGVVSSDAEKSAIETKATEVAGKDKVTNELKVVPKD